MKIAALMPTYGRPQLVANALACFLAQDYSMEKRRLLILDDAGQIAPQSGADWQVWSTAKKLPSLPAKYKFLVDRANEWGADAYCIWDDDDIYLPWHLSSHVRALATAGWSHPKKVWSLYTGSLELESGIGRFHGALAGPVAVVVNYLLLCPKFFDHHLHPQSPRLIGPVKINGLYTDILR
jgi:hypothetical protein